MIILADIALSYDDQIAEAHAIRGRYYRVTGQAELAIKEYDIAISLNPNDWMAYMGRGWTYRPTEITHTFKDFNKAASLNRGPELPEIFASLSNAYSMSGFIEQTRYYAQAIFKLDGDSVKYFLYLSAYAHDEEDFMQALDYGKKALALDSANPEILQNIAWNFFWLGDYDSAMVYYKKFLLRIEELGEFRITGLEQIGYACWKLGMREKADYYFNQQIDYYNRINELGRVMDQYLWTYYNLAAIYAFRGEREKAYENLRIYNQKQNISYWFLITIKRDPLFDSIREESEFQQIVSDMEAKYQAEHQRVKQWLEENDML